MPITVSNSDSNANKDAKKRSVFLVNSPAGKRLIRGASVTTIRQYLLGEVKISKATGDEVASFMEAGNAIEDVALDEPVQAAGTQEAEVKQTEE